MLDQYSLCPCGSGKKFKWCCQPIHEEIAQAFQQDQAGQRDSALRIMDQVVAKHPDNPEAWGKKALLLWQNEKPEEAEAALTKAFEVSPDYPFGHFLRGRFRLYEGEIAGALILFRKAAELYDPAAKEILIEIFLNIFECEMKLNRPVAARAAAMLALKCDPNNTQLRQGVDEVFSPKNPNLPVAATKAYAFHPTRKVGRAAWDQAMARINTTRLSDVLRAFDALAKQDPEDPAVWYNLGLTQAWLGSNAAAIESLDKYISLESDEAAASDAAALSEILRLGQGMEDQSDTVEYAVTAPLQDPQAFVNGLVQLEKDKKIAGMRLDKEQGILAGFVVSEPAKTLITGDAAPPPRLGAFFMLMGNIVRIWHVNKEGVDAAFALFREKLTATMGQHFESRGPAKFNDVFASSVVVPQNVTSQEEHDRIVKEHLAKDFEESWIHKPRKSLGNIPPIDAAGSATTRKKLLGLLQFLEQIATMGGKPSFYDFSRLRRKLNLDAGAAPADASTASSAHVHQVFGGKSPAKSPDISAMGAQDLAGLDAGTLEPAQLELAFQTAMSVDAKSLAGKFAQALVDRPTRAERPDRYPWHNHLVNLALEEKDFAKAIDCINAGESDDCSNNGGKRRNDFELRRAQTLAKKGDHKDAEDAFDRLISRSPQEWKYRGAATEAFLSARQGATARKFAESALAETKKVNNRDQEGYFQELLEAAKRM